MSSNTFEQTEDPDISYCRLCAEITNIRDLIQHDAAEAKTHDIVRKCKEIHIDLSSNNYLPKAICYSCLDSLRRTSIFLKSTRKAQEKLYLIYSKEIVIDVKNKIEESDAVTGVDQNEKAYDVKLEVDTEKNCAIKQEPNSDFEDQYLDGFDAFHQQPDSDAPLVCAVEIRRKEKKKRKKRKKNDVIVDVKEESEFDIPEELLPALRNSDLQLTSTSWSNLEWRCARCEALCEDVASLRLHSLQLHSTCCMFKCPQCDKTLTQFRALVRHVQTHFRSLKYHCEYCNLAVSSSKELREHRATNHADQRISCKKCGLAFETEVLLLDHTLKYSRRSERKRKEKEVEQTLTCADCSKEFKSHCNLVAHRAVHADRSRNYACHICGKLFYTRGTLGTHILTHEECKPFKCNYCSLEFRAKGNLASHLSVHSGVKPFVCEQCGKSFRVKRHLKSHLIVHTDLMPFSCVYCGKPFRFKTRLNLHLRQHTGAKPYTCMQCQRDFTNGSNYKKHMKRRHNIDTSKKSVQEIQDIQDMQEIPFPMPQLVQKFEVADE